MYYTIIGNSGWQGDGWKVVETVENKQAAEKMARELRQTNPRYSNYQMDVKAHRKTLTEMADLDAFTVKFSDGTIASIDARDYYEIS